MYINFGPFQKKIKINFGGKNYGFNSFFFCCALKAHAKENCQIKVFVKRNGKLSSTYGMI